jgi:hypothetical protein
VPKPLNTVDQYAFWNSDKHGDEYKRLADISNDDLLSEYASQNWAEDRCCNEEERRHSSNNLALLHEELLRRMKAHSTPVITPVIP